MFLKFFYPEKEQHYVQKSNIRAHENLKIINPITNLSLELKRNPIIHKRKVIQ
jgi:hypothetical protein